MNLLRKPETSSSARTLPLKLNSSPKSSRISTDSRLTSLIKIIKWQGRVIVILIAVVVLVSMVKVEDIKLPSQEAVLAPPPITKANLQYNAFAYQNTKLINHGDVVKDPVIEIIGQVYEYKEVKQKWPELIFVLNSASVPLSDTGNYLVNLNLKPGPNIIETSLQINGKDYNRQQIVISYVSTTKFKP